MSYVPFASRLSSFHSCLQLQRFEVPTTFRDWNILPRGNSTYHEEHEVHEGSPATALGTKLEALLVLRELCDSEACLYPEEHEEFAGKP